MAIRQHKILNLEAITLNITCFCRSTQGFLKVLSSRLPLSLIFCHCITCRHQSGNIFCAYFAAQSAPDSIFVVHGPLAEYKSSARVSRFFCGKCGTNVYTFDHSSSRTNICSGALDWEGRDNILSLGSHEFVSDTKDGGSSIWLQATLQPETVPSSADLVFPFPSTQTAARPQKHSDKLRCHCHCRGVQFQIVPPYKDSEEVSPGPLPDLLTPYVTRAHLSEMEQQECENHRGVQWHIRPPHNTRFLAGNCACRSCRKSSGYDIQSWAFVPLVNILSIDNKPIDVDLVELKKEGFLKTYCSSQGRYREFCGRCGATIFWRCDWRPKLLDVSVGLFEEADEGARAEGWLDWCLDRISFEEEAENDELLRRLKEGLAAWKDRTHGRQD